MRFWFWSSLAVSRIQTLWRWWCAQINSVGHIASKRQRWLSYSRRNRVNPGWTCVIARITWKNLPDQRQPWLISNSVKMNSQSGRCPYVSVIYRRLWLSVIFYSSRLLTSAVYSTWTLLRCVCSILYSFLYLYVPDSIDSNRYINISRLLYVNVTETLLTLIILFRKNNAFVINFIFRFCSQTV